MSIFRDFFNVKQSPIFTGYRFGFGGGGAAVDEPLPDLDITGASVQPYTDSTHSWIVQTASNPITITRGFLAGDEVEMMLVGGGGGGGTYNWGATGGGGGGGVVLVPKTKGPEIVTAAGTYPLGVGGGGNGGPSGGGAQPGGQTSLGGVAISLTANGGGAGAPNSGAGAEGGSGGGGQFGVGGVAGNQPSANPGVSGINQYGNPSFRGGTSPLRGGGGGGAGSGGPAPTIGINGGDGIFVEPVLPGFISPSFPSPIQSSLGGYTSPSPHYKHFGAGGGGGARNDGPYAGGTGGGGQGARDPGNPNIAAAQAGATGRGAGGGGGAEENGQMPSAPGSGGCVIIRWKTVPS